MKSANIRIDTTLLDNMIVGRVEPHIYAFSTETVPNYLKVGDTSRGVRVRLEEWKKIFPNLIKRYEHSAQIDEETIFRDFSVHAFLEYEKRRERLQPDTIKDLPYYSKEFFKNATKKDLEEAIADIYQSAQDNNGKYQFYTPDRLPQTLTYKRTETYSPRDNQQQAIDNFKTAVNNGRKKLLMYAVMRFGKSFTAMCCAKEIDAKFVVIVSAKSDVKEEWKKTVESHKDFVGYNFLNSESLHRDSTIIDKTLKKGEKVALFLTLQDLQGTKIKDKHRELFKRQIDLLIVDETHFGARGASYGKVLQEQELSKSEISRELKSIDGFETLDQVEDAIKVLNTNIRLHLSGTPYRILMSDEFHKEDIIAFVQFTDIIDAQKQWDEEHLKADDCNEWDNPYYGFPQMVRFAFNPNESSCKKMEQMRKDGITYAFSELFRPHSMTDQIDGSHRQFVHKTEILDLLKVIDGTKEDKNLLGFLDYDKIKKGKMCRHIVCVLPFRASCDAMAELIKKNKTRFKNLCDYEIINIAGFDDINKYKSTEDVKRAIEKCEAQNKKTLTLTVNRMLTGTTVPQWDTMLYLKGTASPQEYDQAIFRLQNQYITTFKDESGKTIKYNMKPQTLLVDFDPNRMFRLQEMKSQFYNVNTEERGNTQLKARIAKELSVSPIIVLNKNKLQQATPANITDSVREYSRNRSILDDATEIPSDGTLLEDADILKVLSNIAPIDAKNGLQIKPIEGEGDDIDIPDGTSDSGNDIEENKKTDTKQPQNTDEDDKLEKRLAAYYARVLFFAFLTESTVKSLKEVIAEIPATKDNQRIAKHLGIDVNILKLIQQKINPFILEKVDYKIENTNDLVQDAKLSPIERVEVAMHKFGRLSDSEIVTPAKVADEMVSALPFDALSKKKDAKFLDIASKQGEFAIALYKRFGNKAKKHIYAIPTSALTYEFTRKTYVLLGMPVENIFADFTSYDLIGENNENIIKQLKDMNLDVIIGNPPYQESDGGGRESSAISLYHRFIECANTVLPHHVVMIIPARWYSGGKGLDNFRNTMLSDTHIKSIYDYPETSDCFDNLNIRGGVCYFLRDKEYEGPCTVYNIKNGTILSSAHRPLLEPNCNIFIRYNAAISILKKVREKGEGTLGDIVSARNPFGLSSNFCDYKTSVDKTHNIKLYRFGEDAYIKSSQIEKNSKWSSQWKVLVSKASPGGDEYPHSIVSKPIISEPSSVCTETYLVIQVVSTKQEAKNLSAYIQTRFFRFMMSLVKNTQNISRACYAFVPLQDLSKKSDIDWSKSIAEIDTQLYEKYGLNKSEIAFIESMIKSRE